MLSGLKILGIGLCASALYLASGCAPDLSTLDSLYDPNAAGTPSAMGGQGNPNPNGGSGNVNSSAGMSTGTAGGGEDTPQCMNGHRDANETDVDCGGSSTCNRCASGLLCNASKDCQSGYCNTSKHHCAEPTCADGALNGTETSLDCGGDTCDGCDDGETCKVSTDCSSTFCKDGTCANHCDSGKKDADETAIDCGGKDCDACKDGQGCVSGNDCVSKICINKSCKAATCSDQIINQDESDQDCGGTVCAACANSAVCNSAADCASYICTNHKCVGDISVLSDDVIDDFEDGDLSLPVPALGVTTGNPKGRVGSWYVAGDSGCLNSEDPLLLPMKRGKSTRVVHTAGHGCNDWGNLLGTDLNNTDTKQPYDATGTKGVTFWARAGKAVSVTVALPNIDTDKTTVGHTCINCDHSWIASASVTTEWQRFTILYTAFMPEPGNTYPDAAPDTLNLNIVSVQFRERPLATLTETYDLWIDDVAFVR